MIQIAHLSDIHFGNNFNKATWDAVADEVVRFDPDLIVVSGDLVDDPTPSHLLAAKCALHELSRRAREMSSQRANGNGRAAELIIVPGNHDVFESGVAVGMPRLDWFERIFHAADTTAAEAALKRDLRVKSLGFGPDCLGFPVGTRPQDAGRMRRGWARLGAILSGRTIAPWNAADDFANHLGAVDPQPTVRGARSSAVLLALLDSNPSVAGADAATGLVDNDQLVALQSALASVEGHYVARIAVVHHHVLPIAFAQGAARRTGEPMMVLRNAGAVLRILADHKFDLVLHGHWHKSQFARIDFGSDDRDSYPIAVASAGSAAMVSENDTRANSINLIRIFENGRINVQSLYYGAGRAPAAAGPLADRYNEYNEPLSATKRRAHIRARERHVVECDEREQICEITENGDLWVVHRVRGLRYRGPLASYPRRPLGIYIPRHGRFIRDTLEPEEDSSAIRLSEAHDHPDAKDKEVEYFWIDLPGDGLVRGGPAVDLGIRHGCANCMKLTRWEAVERIKRLPDAPAGFDHEWVGARITFPTRRLVLKAKFPPTLSMAQPYVECRRHPRYPLYGIDKWGDAELSPKDAIIDPEVQRAEQQHLRYEAPTRTWILEIEHPFVGYQYSLRWQVPGDEPQPQVAGNTMEWQRVLLHLGQRLDEARAHPNDAEAVKQFALLCDTLETEVCQGGPDERWIISLFIYDSIRLALRPILSRRSWTREGLPRDFEVPYGDGVSGSAFQQRRIIAWNRRSITDRPARSARSLIAPHPAPAVGAAEMVNFLALPVYHPGMENLRRPPPWASIGVVTIGSSSYASPIGGMADAQRRRLRAAAQVQMDAIVQALGGRKLHDLAVRAAQDYSSAVRTW